MTRNFHGDWVWVLLGSLPVIIRRRDERSPWKHDEGLSPTETAYRGCLWQLCRQYSRLPYLLLITAIRRTFRSFASKTSGYNAFNYRLHGTSDDSMCPRDGKYGSDPRKMDDPSLRTDRSTLGSPRSLSLRLRWPEREAVVTSCPVCTLWLYDDHARWLNNV